MPEESNSRAFCNMRMSSYSRYGWEGIFLCFFKDEICFSGVKIRRFSHTTVILLSSFEEVHEDEG